MSHLELGALTEPVLAALNASTTGMLVVDRQGIIQFASSLACQILGYEPHDLTQQSISIVLPSDAKASHARWVEAFFANPAKRPMGSGRDLAARCADGSLIP